MPELFLCKFMGGTSSRKYERDKDEGGGKKMDG
jgi:hypothetical protein